MDGETAFLAAQGAYDPDDYDPANINMDDETVKNGDEPSEADAQDDDDEDYDPSSFNYAEAPQTATDDASAPETPAVHTMTTTSQVPGRATSVAPASAEQLPPKPRAAGGFIMEDSDDEENEMTRNPFPAQAQVPAPAPSQLNGTSGAASGVGAMAQDEANVSLRRVEPTDADTDTAAAAASSTSLNGSSLSLSAPAIAFPSPSAVQTQAQTQGKVSSPPPAPVLAVPVQQLNGSVPPTPATIAPTNQRLPNDIVGQLEDRIKEDPKAETAAWLSLIKHYRDRNKIDEARRTYDRFLQVFPTAASVWLEYGQMELQSNDFHRVDVIFSTSLMRNPSIQLWNLYVDYIRRRNPTISDASGEARTLIQQAFEVSLERLGIDPDSGKLWREWVEFVKSFPGAAGGSGWQDAQKADLLRRAYHRAIALPHSELTKLWKEYDNFETGLNKAAGRKALQERSPAYMTARTANTQLSKLMESVDRRSLPKLPPLYGCAGEEDFGDQVDAWRKWIAWEKEDPLVLKNEDLDAYRKRVLYVYTQATVFLRFYPDMWFDATSWCYEQGTEEYTRNGDAFLDDGMVACPESVLLALKKADLIETTLEAGDSEEALKRKGDRLEVPFESLLSSLYALAKTVQEREKKQFAQVDEYFSKLPAEQKEPTPEAKEDDDDDADIPSFKPKSRKEELEAQKAAVKANTTLQIDTLKRTISSAWIAMMRAFRRIQGHGGGKAGAPIKGFRGIFLQARPRGLLTSDLYIASAMMEHHCYKDPAATKIFERALKLFATDEMLALEYIKHLIGINDLTNARAVFETTITKLTTAAQMSVSKQREKCRPLLIYMHAFESAFGDLAQITRIEARMKQLYPEDPSLSRFAHRFETSGHFDATGVQLIISPTQARPKRPPGMVQQHPMHGLAQQHAQSPSAATIGGGQLMLGPNGPYVASPKRPLDDSDSEAPQAKFARSGDSPLKGAAGRRLENARQNKPAVAGGASAFTTVNYRPGQPNGAPPPAAGGAGLTAPPPMPVPPPQLPPGVLGLLAMIPGAKDYHLNTKFDNAKMVNLIKDVDLGRARIAGAAPQQYGYPR